MMADRELDHVSPTYAAICRAVAADEALCALLDELPRNKRQPNLLLAAVRFRGGPIDPAPAFCAFAREQWPDVERTIRARRTQTNEVRRCTALLPVLAGLPQPLALLEVGASAGLCLFPDRWTYRYGTHVVGDGPTLDCQPRGRLPLPDRLPEVVWRAGLDLQPLDVRDDEDVQWLEALVWPEQTERFDLLRAAVDIARTEPPQLVAGDLTIDVAHLASQAPEDATLVVFHSAVLAYVDDDGRDLFAGQLREIAAHRTVCWLANEAPGVVAGTEGLRVAESRFVVSRDGVPVAVAGPHGQYVDWLG